MPSTETAMRRTVLVVDDDQALLHTLTDILGLRGYEVETVDRGAAAIDRMVGSQRPPLVAVVDVGLPDVSGLEVAETVRDRGGLTQVVILTGDATVQSAIGALRASSVDYLVKPVDPGQLFETIERAFERALRRTAESTLESERRRHEAILDASPVGFVVMAGSGEVEYLNPLGADLLGLSRGTLGHENRDRISAWLRTLTGLRTDGASLDSPYQHPEAGERVLSCKVRTLGNERGHEGDRLVAFTDVTASRRVEERLRQTLKLEAIGRLAGGVAHDFNNLLTVILANAEFVAGDLPEESPHRDDLEAIRNAALQAADVAGQLLTFGRRDPGRVEPVDLNEAVRGIETLLARTIGEDIELRDDLDPSIPRVESDLGQLRQVIMNLAMNARDAMEGGGVLTFATGWQDPEALSLAVGETGGLDGPWVYLDVVDTGHGMDVETRTRVFEPFFTTKAEGKGTGLGLATVYGIVSQMGGLVDIESTVGVGTRFRVSLPASADALATETVAEDVSLPQRGRTILVVDDEDRVRTLLRRLLIRDGHQVLEASHGREALEVAEQYDGPIDLVMTDHRMPGLPPARFISVLLASRPETAVLVVTGSATGEQVTTGLAETGPVVSFLSKPFDAERVRRAVSSILAYRDSGEGPQT